ncbi:enoyl-CoA hydratase/isomerase family protein [Alcaligenaceae bacterium]|nr:enoyl-CoA hydratase/isomerase family protein [Alcaligenaceae bacterium]
MAIDFSIEAQGVAVITINRPEARNALDQQHYDLLSDAWRTVRDDDNIKVAIITGAGNQAFCAGADLKTFLAAPPSLAALMRTQDSQLLNRGLEIWKPVVAAVNGYCVGGGMTLLLATDIRVSAEHARFGLSEVQRGAFPANGGTQRISQQLPHAIAMEILLIGDQFDAQTASRWGLVNQVVASQDVMPAARAYALRLAANAPLAVQAAKELAVRSRDVDLATGLRMEQLFLRLLQDSNDIKEGAAAFSEKRPPQFQGQ